ncbi:MAG: hypothetical protein F2667_03475 [Actinobacteria bacterium]|uniref:Unannotated protein n=1 Tax=freshwater metagenome TaxID=449393 RepID=A0A6J6P7W5_9ZZZZ|nr:hypothetical protein [Actinomycetota bacterium]
MAKAKFDIKSEATKSLYVGAGVADLAVEAVREVVADVQKKFVEVQKDVQTKVADVQKTVTGFEFQPKALREQAVTVVNTRVEVLTDEAKARRSAVEARVAELQSEAKALPTKVQTVVLENVATATTTYADLAKRGEVLVGRIRKQETSKATVTSAKTTVSSAKATKTTAKKATKKAVKKTTPAAKRTTTSAKKTVSAAAKAAPAAATKVGD